MKRKYLIYTLFALLAANMSWNFDKAQQVQLASADGSYIEYQGERVFLDFITEEERTNLSTNETETVKKYKILRTEGDLCETCLENQELEILVPEGANEGNLLTAEISAILERVRQEEEEAAEEARLAELAEEREERRKKEENCRFEEKYEVIDCLQKRITEIRDELNHGDLDRDEKRELESKYDSFMNRVSNMAENHLEDVREEREELYSLESELRNLEQQRQRIRTQAYQARNPWQRKQLAQDYERYSDEIDRLEDEIDYARDDLDLAQENFEDFKDYNEDYSGADEAIERTIEEFEKAEKRYAYYQDNYNHALNLRMQAQLSPHPYMRAQYYMNASAIERNLTHQIDSAPRYMSNSLDQNFKGGLSRGDAEAYISLYDQIKREVEQGIGRSSLFQDTDTNGNLSNPNLSNQVPSLMNTSRLGSSNTLDLSNLGQPSNGNFNFRRSGRLELPRSSDRGHVRM